MCLPMPLQPSTAPDAISELATCSERVLVSDLVCHERPFASTPPRSSITRIGAERLCESIPIITPTGLLLTHRSDVEQGGHRCVMNNRGTVQDS